MTDALTLRPELVKSRQDLELAYLGLLRDKNSLLPDLRFVSSYGINGVGNRLDGADDTNALRSLASNHFNNWTLGLRLEVPIGGRAVNALVRRDRLTVAQRLADLKNQEELAVFDVQGAYRSVIESQEQMRIQHARRLAAARDVKARVASFEAGLGDIYSMLVAQRNLADSMRDEQLAVVAYNTNMAHLARFRGTILTHNNIHIEEGPLPEGVFQRATEQFRKRQHALVLRERPTVPDYAAEPADVQLPTSWVEKREPNLGANLFLRSPAADSPPFRRVRGAARRHGGGVGRRRSQVISPPAGGCYPRSPAA